MFLKKEISRRKYLLIWYFSFFVIFSLIMTVYVYDFSTKHNLKIYFNEKIQENYEKHLIDINDKFIDLMLEFEDLIENPNREYSETELKKLSNNLSNKNELLKDLQKTPPNNKNSHLSEIYKDILKLYAFYIQGEVMRFEYVNYYQENYSDEEIENELVAKDESLIMGTQLVNMMGALILENPLIINAISNTNIESKYKTKEIEFWLENYEETLNN